MPTVVEQQDRASIGNNIQNEQSAMNEAELFIENMQLTEPMKFMQVPNHLLETKTYAKVGRNDLVHARPSVIHFEGFQIGEKQVKRLLLLNASSDLLRMHIIPPQTQYFSIKYTKPDRMVPGLALECVVEFTPDEWRYYYDSIRIHCPGEDNLIIPIHGYPVMSTKDFPRNYTFQPIPVGSRISKSFPLRSMAPIDFEFSFRYIQLHPALSLEPLYGIIPANSHVEITVEFTPLEFQTAIMIVELNISQFNSRGILCTFTGSCQPGLLRDKTLNTTTSEVLDPKNVSPLDRTRANKQVYGTVRFDYQRKRVYHPKNKIQLEKDGVRFPAVIDNPHAVAKVLMQEPGKLKASELKQNLLSKDTTKDSTRQMKEVAFDLAVRHNVHEERQNQLRWQVKIGDDPLLTQHRYRILEDRWTAIAQYKLKTGEPVPEDELSRQKTLCAYLRTVRNVGELPAEDATFDIRLNDLWASRYAALNRFVQAARKIIIRRRADKRLNSGLKSLVANMKKGIFVSSEEHDDKKDRDDLVFTADKVQKYKFPNYVVPNVKDDLTPGSLGIVPFTPTQVVIKREIPFFNLKVPQYYKIQGYQKNISYNESIRYAPKRAYGLRTGAEDEIIKIPVDEFSPCQEPRVTPGDEGLARPLKTVAFSGSATEVGKKESVLQPLRPPDALFKRIDYPDLHIVNPAPGLQVFLQPLPYSEIDCDYHLCPLPRYREPGRSKLPVTRKRFLNREDTIKGIMSWRKFPSPGLISVSNTPSLTSVWVPRWDNYFSKDLLPVDMPPMHEKLEADDAENCVESDETCLQGDSAFCLTPEMISQQFALPDLNIQWDDQKSQTDEDRSVTGEREVFPCGSKIPVTNVAVGVCGPMTKEKREEELEYFITKKYNKFGVKVSAKIAELDAMISDEGLILK